MRTLALLSLLTVALSADTITLKNGRIMNGTYLGGTAREIRLDMGDHVETIPIDRVSTLQFDNPAPAPAPAPAVETAPPPPPSNFDRFNANPQPPNNAPPQQMAGQQPALGGVVNTPPPPANARDRDPSGNSADRSHDR